MTFWLILGIVLGSLVTYAIMYIRRDKHYVGSMILTQEGDKKIFSLELDKDPDELASMESITFKIVQEVYDENRE